MTHGARWWSRCRKKDRANCRWQVPIKQSRQSFQIALSSRDALSHQTANSKSCASPISMSHADSTFPLKYLTRHLVKKMTSQSDHPYALEGNPTRELTRRLLLDDQQRRIETRNILEESYRPPICPYYSLSGHADCWYCRQHSSTRPSTSTDTLLRDLVRLQSQVSRWAHLNLIID